MNHSCQEWLSITFYGSWENEGKDRDKISLALVGKKKKNGENASLYLNRRGQWNAEYAEVKFKYRGKFKI